MTVPGVTVPMSIDFQLGVDPEWASVPNSESAACE